MNETLVRIENKTCNTATRRRLAPATVIVPGHRSPLAKISAWPFKNFGNCRSKAMHCETQISEGCLHRRATDLNRNGHKLLLLINAILALVALSAKAAGL